jgi:hypothetical protein
MEEDETPDAGLDFAGDGPRVTNQLLLSPSRQERQGIRKPELPSPSLRLCEGMSLATPA